MIQISDKTKCCGCTACASGCPQKCISMQCDKEGFLYPVVNKALCVNCGVCEKVCPVNNLPPKYEISSAYIARNKELDVVKSSSSGGFFDALCKWVVHNGGVVVGAVYADDFSVYHKCAETIDGCKKFYGSKYVQSNLNNTFYLVKKNLMNGRLVCFSGTPCQIAGLKRYLNRDYANLLLVDLVCHGVPSPMLWEKYLSMMEDKYHSKIVLANFRSKKFGYQCSAMNLKFEDGTSYFGTARVDVMLKMFFSHIALRPICYTCPFKGAERTSDITIYDCWHGASILGTQDDDLGYTSVLVRGDKGQKIIEQLAEYLMLYKEPIERVVPINGGMMTGCAKKHKNRDEFYVAVNNEGLRKAFDRFLPVSPKDMAVENVKAALSKTGFLHKISRAKKMIKKQAEKIKS